MPRVFSSADNVAKSRQPYTTLTEKDCGAVTGYETCTSADALGRHGYRAAQLSLHDKSSSWEHLRAESGSPIEARIMHETVDRIWQIIEKVGVCMLTTRFRNGLRARPLEARPDRDLDRLLFVTDVHSSKHDEIERWPEVGPGFIDHADKAYLSISGTAQIVNVPQLRVTAWRKNDAVWWPGGPSDPDVCVLIVEPATAELWDGPSSAAVVAHEFAKARATGTEPNLGENRKTTVDMRD